MKAYIKNTSKEVKETHWDGERFTLDPGELKGLPEYVIHNFLKHEAKALYAQKIQLKDHKKHTAFETFTQDEFNELISKPEAKKAPAKKAPAKKAKKTTKK